jgi:hypothetical protein
MLHRKDTIDLDRTDWIVALVILVCALAVYVRTLAPDVLYADSAEFQTLAYTLGNTHSTGYPTYLFLGRLLGFLPIGNPAWRISLLSAVSAAITVSGVYLLARHFTRDRVGPVLGSIALGISYTFWAQAVIAEVYTPGMAFLFAIMLLLYRWHLAPAERGKCLLLAALLAGVSVGVHASVWLIAPPAVAFVVWTLWARRATWSEWKRSLLAGFAGAVLGVVIFVAAFLITDRLNPPSSFIRVMLYPSRSFWNLQPSDLSSPFQRLWLTVSGLQWRNAMFPAEKFSLLKETEIYGDRLTQIEFSLPVLLLAGIGLVVMVITRPALGAFMPVAFVCSLYFILNYQVGDKYVFYLSTYIPIAVAVGTGMGFVLEVVHRYLAATQDRRYLLIYLLPVAFFFTTVVQPYGAVRWEALRTGVANFVKDDYAFPVKNLQEPRQVAEMRLLGIPDNAVLVSDWRALYTTVYIAHVEQGRTNILFIEAMPHGNNGRVATTLISELTKDLEEGRPVYIDKRYPGLEDFRVMPAGASNWYRLTRRE